MRGKKGYRITRIAQDDVRIWWIGDLLLSCRQCPHLNREQKKTDSFSAGDNRLNSFSNLDEAALRAMKRCKATLNMPMAYKALLCNIFGKIKFKHHQNLET